MNTIQSTPQREIILTGERFSAPCTCRGHSWTRGIAGRRLSWAELLWGWEGGLFPRLIRCCGARIKSSSRPSARLRIKGASNARSLGLSLRHHAQRNDLTVAVIAGFRLKHLKKCVLSSLLI